ncbi:MAG: PQQ-binding-like beta-propeller repeat protein, partial [Planctomycetaceae bacterium]
FSSALGGDGPRGTPTVHDARVYALGATGKLNCLDAVSGAVLWSHDVLADAQAENLAWGMAGSPLVAQGRVIVAPGGGHGKSVLAYAVDDGRLVWSHGMHPASYSALRSEVLNGRPHVLLFDGQGLAGLDPESGAEFWRQPWENAPQVNAAQPIIHDGHVLISSGYGQGSALLDVSHLSDAGVPETVWNTPNRFKLKFNDAVYHEGYVYGLDEGILSCIEASSGRRLWKRGRYGYGQLLLAGDALIVMAETGIVALVAADSDGYRELSRFRALHDVTWNHPVLHRGHLFVRNSVEAVCYDISNPSSAVSDRIDASPDSMSDSKARSQASPASAGRGKNAPRDR